MKRISVGGRAWRRRSATVVVVALAAAALAEPGTSTPPQTASGTAIQVASFFTGPPRFADGNVFLTQIAVSQAFGTFTGTMTQEATLVIHPGGTVNFRGITTCVCTVDGRSGTLTFRVVGSGVSATEERQIHLFGFQGTGELTGLHAELSFETATSSYSGIYHFDP